MSLLSRRGFLKLGASALLTLALKPLPPEDLPAVQLGRVAVEYLRVRHRPSSEAKQVGWLGPVVQEFVSGIGTSVVVAGG